MRLPTPVAGKSTGEKFIRVVPALLAKRDRVSYTGASDFRV
jgi:hypothetical protein